MILRMTLNYYQNKVLRISILGKQECFGITDCILGCPYSSISVKCHSREGVIQKLDRIEFFKRIKHSTLSMNKVVRYKLRFIALRIMNLMNIHNILIPTEYTSNLMELSFDDDSSQQSDSNSEPEYEADDKQKVKYLV